MEHSADQPEQSRLMGLSNNFHYLAYPTHLLVWMSDANGQCSFVSPSWTTFTGRENAQELGSGWLDHVHPEDREVLVRGLYEARHCRAGDQKPFQLMFRYRRRDGAYRWLMSQGMPHSSPTELFIGFLCLCFDVTPYQEGEVEMESAIQNVFPLLKQTKLIAVILDSHGRIQFSNGRLCQLLNRSANELFDSCLFEQHLAASDQALFGQLYPDGVQNTLFPAEFESELLAKDENPSRFVSWHSFIWRDYYGRAKGTMLIGDDLTELRHEREQTSLYVKAFEATAHAIVVTDVQGTILSVNQAFTTLTGYSREEAVGSNPKILQSGRHDKAFYRAMWTSVLTTGHWHGDVWDRHKGGNVYSKYLSISAIKNSVGETTNFIGIFYDNSERKTIEERLQHLAHYDALTGLPNRSLLRDRMEQAVERAIRLETKVAMLYLDLDHFKDINDTMGHGTGDALLKAVAQRMKTCVRGVDTIARLGGDEFVVLVPDINNAGDVDTVAEKLMTALMQPYIIEGQSVLSTPSIGISIYPDDGRQMDDLMKHADTAMYKAKQSGRGNFKFFNNLKSPKTT
jgi:diguanylate cyclase (GGDEF)-like protein/PAS domain S-box-containing protein